MTCLISLACTPVAVNVQPVPDPSWKKEAY
jgi:hypothetical protein